MTLKKISIVFLLIIFAGAMLGACGLPEEDAEDFDEDMDDPFQPGDDFDDPVEEDDEIEDDEDFEEENDNENNDPF